MPQHPRRRSSLPTSRREGLTSLIRMRSSSSCPFTPRPLPPLPPPPLPPPLPFLLLPVCCAGRRERRPCVIEHSSGGGPNDTRRGGSRPLQLLARVAGAWWSVNAAACRPSSCCSRCRDCWPWRCCAVPDAAAPLSLPLPLPVQPPRRQPPSWLRSCCSRLEACCVKSAMPRRNGSMRCARRFSRSDHSKLRACVVFYGIAARTELQKTSKQCCCEAFALALTGDALTRSTARDRIWQDISRQYSYTTRA